MPLLRKLLAGLALALVVSLATAYVARDALITRYVNRALADDPSLRCEPLALRLSPDLGELTALPPLDCRIRKGPITRVRSDGPVVAELRGLRVARVRVQHAVLDQRERQVAADCDALGELANWPFGFTDTLLKGLIDGAENYAPEDHVTTMKRLTARRGGKLESELFDVHAETIDGWNRVEAKRAHTPGLPLIRVTELVMRVKPDQGSLEARVLLDGAGDHAQPLVRVALRGARLREPTPRCSLALGAGSARP